MRVYVGMTFDGLSELHRTSELGPAPLRAHAVTPALRESYADGDTEELEYVALTAAALDSLRRLAGGTGPMRRVVVVAEVPDAAVTPTGETRSSVTVGAVVPLTEVASVHLDDEANADRVGAAAVAVGGGDETAEAVEDAQAEELMWFATQELPYLLG